MLLNKCVLAVHSELILTVHFVKALPISSTWLCVYVSPGIIFYTK